MPTSHDLAEALIRMFGPGAAQQAKANAASNAQAGDTASAKMWQSVAEIVTEKLARGTPPKPAPR
jgi:ubiquinone biosynthesis protein UbiJ